MHKPAAVSALQGMDVIYVDCGDFHSTALTSEGKVYSWGGGGSFFNRGQCGHGNQNDYESPEMIHALSDKVITAISCGGYHSMALTVDNELYAWGSGLYGECGTGEFSNCSAPRQVLMPDVKRSEGYEDLGPIIQIACGGHHSLVLTQQGFIYSFGFASYGQLGLRSTTNQCEP
jgi:alpha-tubulin suppressor-like RCC1 family protein